VYLKLIKGKWKAKNFEIKEACFKYLKKKKSIINAAKKYFI
jgi:hypothetical protein